MQIKMQINLSLVGRGNKKKGIITHFIQIFILRVFIKKITRTVLAIKMKGFSSSQGAIMHKIDQKGPICTLCQ